MKNNTGLFQTFEDREHGWMWSGYTVKVSRSTEVKINDKKFMITPGFQKVLIDTSNILLKKLNDKDREIFINNLESLDFENYKAILGESKSGRCKNSNTKLEKRVSESNLEGRGVKIVILSNIIDIYTRV